jgi:hypothetical protein
MLSSIEIGEEEEEDTGMIGRGLSGKGVWETEGSGRGFDLSPRKAPSMMILEGGESTGSRRRGLSKALSSIEVGEEVDKGVIRKASSMKIFEARRESMRVSIEKEDKELIRSIAGCMSCTGASFEAGRGEVCGRSGEGGEMTLKTLAGVADWTPCARANGTTSRPSMKLYP